MRHLAEALEPRTLASASVRFAVVGDYGSAGPAAADVAALVKSRDPDFVITTGDNNYDAGAAETIDANVGQYFHDYLFNYPGRFGPGSPTRRFFPTLGNHDWGTPGAEPYLRFFDLPDEAGGGDGGERYYDFAAGPVHFFALDSDPHEPHGVGPGSAQRRWLRRGLAAAPEPFKVVYFHHPPHSSGAHGGAPDMRWPFKAWGVTAVLAGHDHTYERLEVGGLTYFVNGLGGRSIYEFPSAADGSRVRFNGDYGAMFVEGDESALAFRFVTRGGQAVDEYTLGPSGRAVGGTPDLAVEFAGGFPGAVPAGGRGRAAVRLGNAGARVASGRVAVSLFASADRQLDPDDAPLVMREVERLSLKPGKFKRVKFRFEHPGPGQYFLLARVTADPGVAGPAGPNDVAASDRAL